MTHRCTGDPETCGICARVIDHLTNDGGNFIGRRGISLRKPAKPMPYEQLAALMAETRANNQRGAA